MWKCVGEVLKAVEMISGAFSKSRVNDTNVWGRDNTIDGVTNDFICAGKLMSSRWVRGRRERREGQPRIQKSIPDALKRLTPPLDSFWINTISPHNHRVPTLVES